ncbi:hypothetical protein Q7C36_011096 [Tachysurus vachellii]|uniref:BEN domain-containing protein n=1 Tax=Tachysurus vachellii TaxID=175792 RepID=A0AA88SQP2_TACVA|nr:hypothetical protein Q7C36_011096 [Tachysurus vachellii]
MEAKTFYPKAVAKKATNKRKAALTQRRSPAVSISKQLSALTQRLVDLEAKVVLLEARLNERSHPPTTDKSTATDSPVDVLPTPAEPRTECQQATHIHLSGHGEFSLTSGHLDIDSVGFPSAVSTPCIDRTRPAYITEDSAINHQLSNLDYNYSPVQESASTMSNTSQQCPSAMSSFCLRLPETPRNASNFQSHNSVRRSLMGVILEDVTLNYVADSFAAGLFKRLIPLTVYHDWVGSVNYDGSKGKNALPLNLRQAISDAVARKFQPSLRDWKLVRDRIN